MTTNTLTLSAVDLVAKTLGMPAEYDGPEDFLGTIASHGLSPLLYHDIRRRGLESMFPKEVIEGLRTNYILTLARNDFLLRELATVIRALREAEIVPIVMKGAHLAESLYEDSGLRTMGDVDLLVRRQDFGRAREVLVSVGYSLEGELLWNTLDTNRTGYHYLKASPSDWVCVELHNHPVHGHRTGSYSKFDIDAIWRRAVEIKVAGETALGMSPLDLMLFLSWHYRFHEFERLIWLYDIGLVLQRYGPSLNWRELVKCARQLRLGTTLHYCLRFVEETLGVAADPWVLKSLKPAFVPRKVIPRLFDARGHRLLGAWEHRPLRVALQHLMVQNNFDLLRVAFRLLFPSRVGLGSRYVNEKTWRLKLIFLFYLVHPFIVLGNGLKSLLALAPYKERLAFLKRRRKGQDTWDGTVPE